MPVNKKQSSNLNQLKEYLKESKIYSTLSPKESIAWNELSQQEINFNKKMHLS